MTMKDKNETRILANSTVQIEHATEFVRRIPLLNNAL